MTTITTSVIELTMLWSIGLSLPRTIMYAIAAAQNSSVQKTVRLRYFQVSRGSIGHRRVEEGDLSVAAV